ncbi:hypothetical protein BH10BDE1_BH10BDE1_18820 [soil metagenome]
MFRRKRPMSGPVILIAIASALALSNLACAKKETIDAWQLQPPTLEMNGTGGTRLQLRASEVMKAKGVMRSLIGDEVASLQFALADRGLALAVKSQCRSIDGADFSYATASLTTAEAVALISLVPPQTLTPEALKKEWNCTFRMRVTNELGSHHDFAFSDVKMSFRANTEKTPGAILDSAVDAMRVKSQFGRRLICSTWWTDSSDADLATMSRTEKVNGLDTRATDRQPVCTVMELSSKAKLVGYYRPAFAGPRTVWNREVLIANGYLPDLFHQPLVAWNIRNDSATAQVYFVSTKAARVHLSGLFQMTGLSDDRFWSRPTLALQRLSVVGALEEKETPEGFYFRVASGATARLTLNSNHAANILSRYDFSRVTFRMVITTEQPILLESLAGGSMLSSLAGTPPPVLDTQARDVLRGESDTLLSALVLGNEAGGARLTEMNQSLQQAQRWGKPMATSSVLNPNKTPAEVFTD